MNRLLSLVFNCSPSPTDSREGTKALTGDLQIKNVVTPAATVVDDLQSGERCLAKRKQLTTHNGTVVITSLGSFD